MQEKKYLAVATYYLAVATYYLAVTTYYLAVATYYLAVATYHLAVASYIYVADNGISRLEYTQNCMFKNRYTSSLYI